MLTYERHRRCDRTMPEIRSGSPTPPGIAINCKNVRQFAMEDVHFPSVKDKTDALWASEFQFDRPGFTEILNGDDSFRLTLFRRQA
jgi:hypothetical protein